MLLETLAIPTQPKMTKNPTIRNILFPTVTARIISSGSTGIAQMISQEYMVSNENENLSELFLRFFLIESSVENIIPVNLDSVVLDGNEVEINSSSIPSGLVTEIVTNGEPVYLASY